MTAAPMAVAAAVLLLAAAVDGRLLVAPPHLASLLSIVFLGVFCSGVAFLIWFRAVSAVGPARSGVYLYVEPFVTLALAWSMLDEPVMVSAVRIRTCTISSPKNWRKSHRLRGPCATS